MVECWLPYGKTEVHISVPLRYLMGTIEPASNNIVDNPFQSIADSIQKPIGTPTLNEQVKSYSKISIAIDGTIHYHLLANTLSSIVWALNQAGGTSENITIIIANGHRESGSPDMIEMLRGLELLKNTTITDHNKSSTDLEQIGATSSGTVLQINKNFTSANFKIAVGPVIPDPFSGLKGAQSTILPGLTSLTSYQQIRSLAFDANISMGDIGDNPVYSDQVEAFDMAKIDLAVNLVTDQKGGLIAAFSGTLKEVGIKKCSQYCEKRRCNYSFG
jgi:nickel-dependent lactate racemase